MDRLNKLPPALVELLRGYATVSPTRLLEFPTHLSIEVVHEFLLNDLLHNAHFALYAPSVQYQTQFWKWALRNLERMNMPEVGGCASRVRLY